MALHRSQYQFHTRREKRDSGNFSDSVSSQPTHHDKLLVHNTTGCSSNNLETNSKEAIDLEKHNTEKIQATVSTYAFFGGEKVNCENDEFVHKKSIESDSEGKDSATPLLNRKNAEYILESEQPNDSLYKPSVRPLEHILVSENEPSDNKLQLGHADVEVINRCDGLINHLQDTSQKYYNLVESYKKNKKLFYILAIINIILILSVVIFVSLVVHLRRGSESSARGRITPDTDVTGTAENHYPICFNCAELRPSGAFSLETLIDVSQTDGKCCFRSIISVMKSQSRMFQIMLDERSRRVENTITLLDKRLLQLEIGSAPDTNEIIRNILTTLAPKEKTAVYLKSVKGRLIEEVFESFGKLNKLRWSSNDQSAILRGNIQLSEDDTSIHVMSEAYYFLYTKIQYRPSELAVYNPGDSMSLSYLVYRKRGSISSYIHEAKINCIFNDRTQEYSSTSEMILHLNRDDEIFISVVDAYKQFLSTDSGAHMIGLFEI